MLIKSRRNQSGITLIELIIASAIGLAVLSSTIALFSNSTKINSDTLKMTRLNQELRAIMDIMARDIRRAGYWRNATTMIGTGVNTNPFSQIGTGSPFLQISDGVAVDCILFYYDQSDDGAGNTTPSSNEKFGFKLNSNAVDMRKGGSGALSCTYASDNQWEGISDPNVTEITALSFTPTLRVVDLDGTGPGTATITIREITISMTGKLVDGEFPVGSTSLNRPTRTLTETVRVRNDLFTP